MPVMAVGPQGTNTATPSDANAMDEALTMLALVETPKLIKSHQSGSLSAHNVRMI
jgi:hypothetical protein